MVLAIFAGFKKVRIFPLFDFFAVKAVRLDILTVLFVFLPCHFYRFKFKLSDDDYVVGAPFDLHDVFMGRIVWPCYSGITIF